MAVYVAPAARVVTVLHVKDDGSDAVTQCGLPMANDELWQPVEARPGDRVCLLCARRVRADALDAALW